MIELRRNRSKIPENSQLLSKRSNWRNSQNSLKMVALELDITVEIERKNHHSG